MVAMILNYTREHGVLIEMPRGVNSVDLKKYLAYGAHYSVVKDVAFVHKALSEKLRAWQVAIYH